MSAIEVRECRTPKDFTAFIEAGHRAQADNPRWVALLHKEIREAFDKRHSPFMKENHIKAFVALRDGIPVGRIAGIVNKAHLDKYQDATGHFGFIDAIDDAEVFGALFGAVSEFLKAEGLKRLQGPFSLTINHESGLLVKGYDQPHVVRTNHAPPYYAAQIEALGFRKSIDLLACVCRLSESDFPERAARLAKHFPDIAALKTHGHSFFNLRQRFPQILALYNDAWQFNWGSTPVSQAEARMIGNLTLPVSKPSWIRIAEWHGEPVALLCQIPNVNEALADLKGQLLPFGWAKLLWHIHARGTRMSRVPMIGVARRWRGTRIGTLGVSLLLADAIETARRAGVEEMEISWMLETNHAVLNLIRSLPARDTRTFRIYEKPL
ncbi:GNAT family N-acetyltransferase [Beijerinckia mobilis]|uniref:GNAT family N-acetyltransferase n=1 Tax=Beijerinckia mobilis TaxID=231434 RepID=UPI00068FDA6A|nr:hypothetical protein [Beijerinckia mobilis]